MARKGLGKGLDVLIPDFYDEDFDSNSPQSLEDLLNEEKENSIHKYLVQTQLNLYIYIIHVTTHLFLLLKWRIKNYLLI